MTRPRHFVALDLDGTLEDSRDDMVASAGRVRAALGLPVREPELIRSHVNRGMSNLYRSCFDDHLDGTDARLEQVRRAYETDYLAHVADTTRLYAGIEGALEELATLATLAVVTNKPERISRALLAELGIAGRFADVMGGDSCAESKPSTLPLRLAAAHSGHDPNSGRAFMIGDTAGDVRMGRAYGATTIWCAWGYLDALEDPPPDVRAETPADLPGLVRAALE